MTTWTHCDSSHCEDETNYMHTDKSHTLTTILKAHFLFPVFVSICLKNGSKDKALMFAHITRMVYQTFGKTVVFCDVV